MAEHHLSEIINSDRLYLIGAIVGKADLIYDSIPAIVKALSVTVIVTLGYSSMVHRQDEMSKNQEVIVKTQNEIKGALFVKLPEIERDIAKIVERHKSYDDFINNGKRCTQDRCDGIERRLQLIETKK